MTTHPSPPLALEQREAILALGPAATKADVARVRAEFSERRNREHPNWLREYDQAVLAWTRSQGVRLSEQPT